MSSPELTTQHCDDLTWIRSQPPETPQDCVLLLHGAASNSSRWWHYREHSQLRHSHLILSPTLRGHGEKPWRGPAGMDDWCDDLTRILNQEQQTSTFIVGHCLGAHLALHFAARHPERCRGLALIEPMPRKALQGKLLRLARLAPLVRWIIPVIQCLNHMGVYRRHLRPPDLRNQDIEIQRTLFSNTASDQLPPDQAMQSLIKRYGSLRQDLAATPTVQLINNLLELLKPLPLDSITCPTLALIPEQPLLADPVKTLKIFASLPLLESRQMPAAHWMPTLYAEKLCILVDQWIRKNETMYSITKQDSNHH